MVGRRPLLGFALVAVLGLLTGRVGAVGPVPLIAGAAGCTLLLAARSRRGGGVAAFAAHAAVFCLAAAHAASRLDDPLVVSSAPGGAGYPDVVGLIDSDPEPLDPFSSGVDVWRLRLHMERMRPSGAADWQPANGDRRVRWYVPHGAPVPAYGDRWVLRGVRLPVHDTRSKWRGPRDVHIFSRQAERLSAGNGLRIRAWCYDARRRAASRLSQGIEDFPDHAGLLRALLLGYRTHLPDELHTLGAATGTLHVFAISGLHVGIVASLLIALINSLGVPRNRWLLILGPALVLYTVLTGARPSALRACIMALAYFAAPGLRRRADVPSAVALAALLILAWDPGQLADVGFVYSFVVVVGLVALCPPLMSAMRVLWQRDPLLLPELADRRREAMIRFVASLLVLSVSAWLASMPLTAYYFQRFTPIAVVANLFAIPLAFLAVVSGCLSMVLGAFWVGFAEVFNHAALAIIAVFIWIVRWLSRVPYASLQVARPSIAVLWIYYAALGTLAACAWSRLPMRRGAIAETPLQPRNPPT